MSGAETTRRTPGSVAGVGALLRPRGIRAGIRGMKTVSKEKRMNGEKRTSVGLVLVVMSLLLAAPGVVEGQLTPPAGPNDVASAKFTLGDVYARLATGAAGTKRGAAFAEPGSGPTTATMKTTDQIMAAAPLPAAGGGVGCRGRA